MNSPFDVVRSPQGAITDVVVERGLSLHFFDTGVGIYSSRMECGRGYAQLSKKDFKLLLDFFSDPVNLALLTPDGAPGHAGTANEKQEGPDG